MSGIVWTHLFNYRLTRVNVAWCNGNVDCPRNTNRQGINRQRKPKPKVNKRQRRRSNVCITSLGFPSRLTEFQGQWMTKFSWWVYSYVHSGNNALLNDDDDDDDNDEKCSSPSSTSTRRHRVASSGRRVAPPWPRKMACLSPEDWQEQIQCRCGVGLSRQPLSYHIIIWICYGAPPSVAQRRRTK